MKNLLTCLSITMIVGAAYGQAKTRRLPNTINHPSINLFSPYMSFDGSALVYLSDNAEDYVLTPFFTSREVADWKTPAALPRNINTRLDYIYGYSLNADGRILYFSTMKSPGVGGFDIWMSERKGSGFSEPRNLAAPINSKGNESNASFTADGKTIYFMRCDKMDQKSASGCKIFMSHKKSNGQWEEPVELPPSINTGNSQTPRIMADGETLYFSSDKMADNKGGMDLYMTKFNGTGWSNPVALDFINTPKDDEYISVTALGRYLLRDSPGTRKNELIEYLIPDHLRPKGLMKVEGKITNASGGPVGAYVSAYDLEDRQRVFSGKPLADGSYELYLLEGKSYELAVDPEQDNVSFFSKKIDLHSDKIPQSEKINVTLKPLQSGDEIDLSLVSFKPQSSELDPASNSDLKRLARIMKSSPSLRLEVQVLLSGYEEDSVQSSPDLTEIHTDSITTQIESMDSTGQVVSRDTTVARITYHNDRTELQALSVMNFLLSEGVNSNNLVYFVNARPEAILEKRGIQVKAVVK